jgi:PEGA domain-containing protein
VVVQSDQPDTSVMIDGTSLGKAPLTQLLAPGHHQVAAVASGRAAQTQEFNIEAKETKTLHFDLATAFGTLTASPSPTPVGHQLRGVAGSVDRTGTQP